MSIKSILTLSFATLASAEENGKRSSMSKFGVCPSWFQTQKTTYTDGGEEFNFKDIMGHWYGSGKASDKTVEESGMGCAEYHFTDRSDSAWVYPIGVNSGVRNFNTNENYNAYTAEGPGVDDTWIKARSDKDGRMWVSAMMMPEFQVQVIKATADYMFIHACIDMMMIEHVSLPIIMSRNKSLTADQMAEIKSLVDQYVPATEYTSADINTSYQGDDCTYVEFSP
jgi:hypothetical protein